MGHELKNMNNEELLFDLISYRNKKQIQAEKNASRLFSKATDFAIRYSNIREKVRAKHLFRQQIYYSNDIPLSKDLEDIFQQWFLFDYHTIQGETMFSLFLKQYSSELSEHELIMGALFLTTYVEPFEVVGWEEKVGVMLVKDIFEGKTFTLKNHAEEVFNLKSGDYLFFRKLPLLTYDWIIGTIFPIKTKERVNQLITTYEQTKTVNPTLTWRTYLKRKGYVWLTNAHS
jgi:hypothetical protein